MNDVKLGQLADKSAKRDAIHVAVLPVVAAHVLLPGQHVGLIAGAQDAMNSDLVAGDAPDKCGIVDPYLTVPVKKGQRFYLCMYPQTITSIRHDWTHPAIAAAEDESRLLGEKESEGWLRHYATVINPYDMEDDPSGQVAFERLIEGLKEGEVYTHGTQIDDSDSEELKFHAKRYLGINNVVVGTLSFRCSC